MKRTRIMVVVFIILALALIPTGCAGSEAGVDGGKSGDATLQAVAITQKAETAQEAVTAKMSVTTDTADTQSPMGIETELKPMKDVYKDDFLMGTSISKENLTGDRYVLLNKHFNVITMENDMKPNVLQPRKDKFDFTGADMIANKVLAAGLKIYGHTLVCDRQTPAWMNTDAKGNPLGRVEALDNLKTYITTVMEHFGGEVISWDVVNDAMSAHPTNPQDWKTSLRPTPWLAAIGDDYVEQAFLAAREVLDTHPDWDIKLYYSDCGMDNQSKVLAVYNMVKEINDNYQKTHPGKLLIDGIGMESHFNLDTDPVKVGKSMDKLISLGVEISINELDIQAISNGRYIWESGNTQALLYANLFSVFKKHASNISRITFWGMDDGTSWMNVESVLLFNKNLQARPAYYGATEQLGGLVNRFP